MIVGAGDLGTRVLLGLTRSPHRRSFKVLARDEDKAIRTTNLARFSALQTGADHDFEFGISDLEDVDRTAEELAKFKPDIIFSAASLQSWWVISTLPKTAFQRVYRANFGPWLPMHLVPVANLMRAVRAASSTAIVVNAAFPDAVHPMLKPAGLSPHVGIGNVANPVPSLQVVAADRLGCAVRDVRVRFIAHHYVSHRVHRSGDAGGAPMDVSVFFGDEDVTTEVDPDTLFQPLLTRYRRTGGRDGQAMTAASALSVVEPLADGRDAYAHAPGPGGLPGGYPVRVSAGTVQLDLPQAVSVPDAVTINVGGQRFDGIAEISDDGWATFEESNMDVLEQELGYSCARMHWSDATHWATELAGRYQDYAKKVCG